MKTPPIVPCCFALPEERRAYSAPPLRHGALLYATDLTVRLEPKGGEPFSVARHKGYCLPSDQSWLDAQRLYAELDRTLTALGAALRGLGRYDRVRARARSSSNPLSSLIIQAPCPDSDSFCAASLPYSPPLARLEALSHTAVMLRYFDVDGEPQTAKQSGFFICPSDRAAAEIDALYAAVVAADDAFAALLNQLGSYQDAVTDGRYTVAPFKEGDRVSVTAVDRHQPDIAVGLDGLVQAVSDIGVEVEIVGLRPLLFQPGQLRIWEPPAPQLPDFNEGDLIKGQLAKPPHSEVIGRVDTQNAAVVFVSNDEGAMVGLRYEGIELIEAAPPPDADAPDSFDLLMQGLREDLDPAPDAPPDAHLTQMLPPVGTILPDGGEVRSHDGALAVVNRKGDGFTTSSRLKLTEIQEIYRTAELQALASQINEQHQACEAALSSALSSARACGELLLQARERIQAEGGRNWLSWLQLNFSGSQRTAYNYLAIAERWEQAIAPSLQQDATLGIRGALALLSPDSEREPDHKPSLSRRQLSLLPAEFPDEAYIDPPAADPDPEPSYRPPAVATVPPSVALPTDAPAVSCLRCSRRCLELDGRYGCADEAFTGSLSPLDDWAAEHGCGSFRPRTEPASISARLLANAAPATGIEITLDDDESYAVEGIVAQAGALNVIGVALRQISPKDLRVAFVWIARQYSEMQSP